METIRATIVPNTADKNAVIVKTEEISVDDGYNFHAGNNFHAGQDSNFHAGQEDTNFHAGNFHAGSDMSFHAGQDSNFHAGNFHAGNNFHEGQDSNLHTGPEDTNFHAGNFHAGENVNFHAGQSSNFHAGQDSNFHAGDTTTNFHAGQESKGNFHAGNFHAGQSSNFHAGNNFHAGQDSNFHAGQPSTLNFHAGNNDTNFHTGEVAKNFHAGQSTASPRLNTIPATKISPASGSTTARLVFYIPPKDGSKPYNHVEKPPNNGPHMNFGGITHSIPLTDIRGQESSFNMDTCSFGTLTNLPSLPKSIYTSDETIKSTLYPHIEAWLLNYCSGSPNRVVIFDHTIRRPGSGRAPVNRTHIDQSPSSAMARITRHMTESEAERVQTEGVRVRLINVWLPINGTVYNHPLCFADSKTVEEDDLVAVDHVYPTWRGETLGVKFSERQRWYYWSGMGEGEALLLQCFDSVMGARLAHSSFDDVRGRGFKHRESIEVRALVLG